MIYSAIIVSAIIFIIFTSQISSRIVYGRVLKISQKQLFELIDETKITFNTIDSSILRLKNGEWISRTGGFPKKRYFIYGKGRIPYKYNKLLKNIFEQANKPLTEVKELR